MILPAVTLAFAMAAKYTRQVRTAVLEELNKDSNIRISQILEKTDAIIDGPYIAAERDITLPMRGSRNQRILYKGIDY